MSPASYDSRWVSKAAEEARTKVWLQAQASRLPECASVSDAQTNLRQRFRELEMV